MRKALLVTLVFALALGLECTSKPKVIKLGVAGPMTGDQAKMGMDLMHGVTLAVEEWNAKGGVLGAKIEIVNGDDRRDPKEANSVAQKLVNDGVVAVIGHFNSSCSIPASQIYHENKVPQISPASTNPQLTQQGFGSVFRTCGRDDQQGSVGAKYVLQILKKKRIAVLHDKTTYGQGLADEFKKALGDSAQVVIYEGLIQGDKDFKAVLTKVKQAKPEVVYFGGIYPEAGLLVRQMKDLGIKADFMAGDGVIDPEFLKIAGDAALGSYLSFGPSVKELPTAKRFIEAHQAKYGEIGPYSVYSYDAANIILSALQAAGKLDGDKVAEEIHKIKYDGAIGTIQFDPKGDVLKAPYIFWQVQKVTGPDGKEKLDFVPLKEQAQ
jgi:branched-chain amino acid transport system substrate-binding protein